MFRRPKNTGTTKGNDSFNAMISRASGADFVTRNSMTYQMGFDNFLKSKPSDEKLAEIISAVDNEFDLVLLSEYLPQSLILLRHLLCMTWSDIATMSKNISQRKHFEEATKEKIRRWQNVDTRVYEAANMTFWRKVKDFGEENMAAEMAILEKMNAENAEKCVKGYRPVKELAVEFRDYEPPGLTIEGIELKEGYTDVCYNIALSPFSLAIDILDKQCQSSSVRLLYPLRLKTSNSSCGNICTWRTDPRDSALIVKITEQS